MGMTQGWFTRFLAKADLTPREYWTMVGWYMLITSPLIIVFILMLIMGLMGVPLS